MIIWQGSSFLNAIQVQHGYATLQDDEVFKEFSLGPSRVMQNSSENMED